MVATAIADPPGAGAFEQFVCRAEKKIRFGEEFDAKNYPVTSVEQSPAAEERGQSISGFNRPKGSTGGPNGLHGGLNIRKEAKECFVARYFAHVLPRVTKALLNSLPRAEARF